MSDYWFFKVGLVISLGMVLWLVIAYLIPLVLPERKVDNTEKFGIIFTNERWSGKVVVVGDIWAVPGSKVIIEPGTTVLVKNTGDRLNLDWLPWHLRSGMNYTEENKRMKKGVPFWDEKNRISLHFAKLSALGNKDWPIIIRSDTPRPGDPYDFNLISLTLGKVDHVYLSDYRRLQAGERVIISNSRLENSGECAICLGFGSAEVDNNIFRDNRWVYIDGGMASAKIHHNRFLKSLGEGVILSGDGRSAVVLTDNFFDMPKKSAVRITSTEEGGVILRNFFSSGSITLPCKSNIWIGQNWIKEQVIFQQIGDCPKEYILGENYWEIFNVEEVKKIRIKGQGDLFKVNIPAILREPPVDLPD